MKSSGWASDLKGQGTVPLGTASSVREWAGESLQASSLCWAEKNPSSQFGNKAQIPTLFIMLHSPKSHFIEVTLFFLSHKCLFSHFPWLWVGKWSYNTQPPWNSLYNYHQKPLPHTNKWGTGVPSPKMFKCPIFSTSVLGRNSEFNTLGLGMWFNPVKSFPHKHKDLSSAFKIYIKKAKCSGP